MTHGIDAWAEETSIPPLTLTFPSLRQFSYENPEEHSEIETETETETGTGTKDGERTWSDDEILEWAERRSNRFTNKKKDDN